MPVGVSDHHGRSSQRHPHRQGILDPSDGEPAQQQVAQGAATDRSHDCQDGDAKPVHPRTNGNGRPGDGVRGRPDVFESQVRLAAGHQGRLCNRLTDLAGHGDPEELPGDLDMDARAGLRNSGDRLDQSVEVAVDALRAPCAPATGRNMTIGSFSLPPSP
jgi:hypothetical protein